MFVDLYNLSISLFCIMITMTEWFWWGHQRHFIVILTHILN